LFCLLFGLSRKASSSKEKDKKSETSKEKTATLNQLPKAEVDAFQVSCIFLLQPLRLLYSFVGTMLSRAVTICYTGSRASGTECPRSSCEPPGSRQTPGNQAMLGRRGCTHLHSPKIHSQEVLDPQQV